MLFFIKILLSYKAFVILTKESGSLISFYSLINPLRAAGKYQLLGKTLKFVNFYTMTNVIFSIHDKYCGFPHLQMVKSISRNVSRVRSILTLLNIKMCPPASIQGP